MNIKLSNLLGIFLLLFISPALWSVDESNHAMPDLPAEIQIKIVEHLDPKSFLFWTQLSKTYCWSLEEKDEWMQKYVLNHLLNIDSWQKDELQIAISDKGFIYFESLLLKHLEDTIATKAKIKIDSAKHLTAAFLALEIIIFDASFNAASRASDHAWHEVSEDICYDASDATWYANWYDASAKVWYGAWHDANDATLHDANDATWHVYFYDASNATWNAAPNIVRTAINSALYGAKKASAETRDIITEAGASFWQAVREASDCAWYASWLDASTVAVKAAKNKIEDSLYKLHPETFFQMEAASWNLSNLFIILYISQKEYFNEYFPKAFKAAEKELDKYPNISMTRIIDILNTASCGNDKNKSNPYMQMFQRIILRWAANIKE